MTVSFVHCMSPQYVIFVLQTIPVVATVSVVVVTVLYFLLGGSAGQKKLPVTLQDTMVKYSLPLIDKQVDCTQTQTFNQESVLLILAGTFKLDYTVTLYSHTPVRTMFIIPYNLHLLPVY